MPALEAFHTLGKVHWQTSYALSSQSCETVILLLKAGGTLAITPGGKK